MVVTCYPVQNKPKAALLCESFARGVEAAGGTAKICRTPPSKLEPGAAMFYGVRPEVEHLWAQAKRERRDYFIADNSYFDAVREQQFRVTRNRYQHTGLGKSDGKRFAALGIEIKPMRSDGWKVVVAAQSPEFMEVVAGDPGWLERTVRDLREEHGAGRVIVRTKQERRPLLEDLSDAKLLVTWSSAAAVTALLEGVKVRCAPQCCAAHVKDRRKWAGVLADQQWTVEELAAGLAWRSLCAGQDLNLQRARPTRLS